MQELYGVNTPHPLQQTTVALPIKAACFNEDSQKLSVTRKRQTHRFIEMIIFKIFLDLFFLKS